jgi:hypothetical protein
MASDEFINKTFAKKQKMLVFNHWKQSLGIFCAKLGYKFRHWEGGVGGPVHYCYFTTKKAQNDIF